MARPLSLAQHTLYAELLDQGCEDVFDPEWPENGSIFVRSNRAGMPPNQASYQGYRPAYDDAECAQRYARCIGPADDPAIAGRIIRFQRVKAVRAERAITVRALIGAGMPQPDRITGRIVETFAKAGLFSGRAILMGVTAYQTYDGVVGARLPKPAHAATNNRASIALAVRDRARVEDILDALRIVDPSFATIAHQTVRPTAGVIQSASGVRVVVLVGRRSGQDPAARLVDFLIENAARSLVLNGPGIPVAVPAPERYATSAVLARPLHGVDVVEFRHDPSTVLGEALRAGGREVSLERSLSEAARILRP